MVLSTFGHITDKDIFTPEAAFEILALYGMTDGVLMRSN